MFQGPLGYPDVTFFVPVTAGFLLVSLGADYSVFVMGRIWEEARGRDMASRRRGGAAPRITGCLHRRCHPGGELRGARARAGPSRFENSRSS